MLSSSRKHHRSRKSVLRLWRQRIRRHKLAIALTVTIPIIAVGTTAGLFYLHYAGITDAQLRTGAFQNSTDVYASPLILSEGDSFSVAELGNVLQQAGFAESPSGEFGTYRVRRDTTEIITAATKVRVSLAQNKRIARIELNGVRRNNWSAGSPLVATLAASSTGVVTDREKRHMVTFAEIPQVLVDAVTSTEDKHFFEHHGVDLPRIAKASWVDLTAGSKRQGGSTLTMQLVRGLWLQPEKKLTRKLAEIMMTIRLERKWSKQQIFEAYSNQVFLGRQSAYGVHGFAEGAQMFFSKPLRDLSLPEAALLAGIVQRPSYFNPYRHPERAKDRRDLVLALMRDNSRISPAQYADAVAAPVKMAGPSERDDSFGAPYFLDLVTDELQKQHSGETTDAEAGTRKVYTTLDLNLQRAAGEAITSGMKDVDAMLEARYGKSAAGKAEAALIALDPHTGEIKAIVGGRNYAHSQLNRILANRPPGSIFKPFVYAAALNTGIENSSDILTPSSTVDDSPETFWFGGKPYQPANFHQESFGTMTLRQALAKSDNIAAVKIAQKIGYNAVVAMARRAGLNDQIRATPSVALGSYAVTPLEMAGAWTMFANGGMRMKPQMVTQVRNSSGETTYNNAREWHQALDPRVAYLMVGMLQDVMRSGTAAGVRSRGFVLPAAGKTGTSHDGWFAGFTSQLLCLVWVGFDDYRELNLEGAKSALPIWTEFMKKASRFSAYRNAVEFPQPSGITSVEICHESGKLAGELCTDTKAEVFISGTQPEETCDAHGVQTSLVAAQSQ